LFPRLTYSVGLRMKLGYWSLECGSRNAEGGMRKVEKKKLVITDKKNTNVLMQLSFPSVPFRATIF
jgi:hypothetical protein